MTDGGSDQNGARTFSQPNPSEFDWIDSCLQKAREMTGAGDGRVDLAAMDEAWDRWLDAHSPENEDPNPVINAFGIAFGEHIINDLGLHWAVVTDDHGSELCVHGQPGDILVYPCNFVAKRYVARQRSFFAMLFPEMKNDIRRMQEMWRQDAQTVVEVLVRRRAEENDK